MSFRKDLECNGGENYTADFDDTDGEDRTTNDLVFRLRVGGFRSTVLVTKTVGAGLTFPGGSWPTGSRVRLTLSATNTTLDRGRYYYTISRTDTPEEVVLAHGIFTIDDPTVYV